MAIPAWVIEKWEKLNVENRAQASSYIERLLKLQDDAEPTPARKLGMLADRFEFISEDFNDPIEDFKDYM